MFLVNDVVGNLDNDVGIDLLRLLMEMLKFVKLMVMLGRFLENWLFFRNRLVNWVRLLIEKGIGLVKLLEEILRWINLVNCVMFVGNLLENLLFCRYKFWRWVRFEKFGGIWLERWLEWRFRIWSLFSLFNDLGGIWLIKLVFGNWSEWMEVLFELYLILI